GADGPCPVAHIQWDGPARPALAGHQMLDRLRTAAPVHLVQEGVGFYLITGYEDALSVAQDAETFQQPHHLLATGAESPFELIPETLDGPRHTKWRRLLAPAFSPKQIEGWHDKIVSRANLLIDGFIDAGECDFTSQFALRYPTAIFLDLMGLPLDQLEDLLR